MCYTNNLINENHDSYASGHKEIHKEQIFRILKLCYVLQFLQRLGDNTAYLRKTIDLNMLLHNYRNFP